MIIDEIYNELVENQKGGARHRNLINLLRNANHNGCDISEDQTMICAMFETGIIIVAPYGIIRKYNIK